MNLISIQAPAVHFMGHSSPMAGPFRRTDDQETRWAKRISGMAFLRCLWYDKKGHITTEEFENLMCKNFTSSWGGRRKPPYAFTEQGIYLLMTVLRGELMEHCGTKAIETKRLRLRQLSVSDAEPMYRNWASDPEVTKFLTWPPHESVEGTKTLLAEWKKEYEKADYYQWGIERKSLGEVIGTISVVGMKESIEMAHIGYCIGRAFWHQGIMTEALGAVISFLFNEVKCNRIESRYDTNNPHSGEVMKKCGMQFEGIMRAADRNNQGICDVGQYAILRSDYLQLTCYEKA